MINTKKINIDLKEIKFEIKKLRTKMMYFISN